MAKPSRKGAKPEDEIAADAKKKKEILKKVAESNLPTKTILKELGISRSTYYSWLKRYQEEGEEGLLDSRSLTKPEDEVEAVAPPVEDVKAEPPQIVAEDEVLEESPPERVPEAASVEEPPSVKVEEPTVAPSREPSEKKEEVAVPDERLMVGGDEPRRGIGGYAFIAIMLLVVGLLVSISLSNHNSYRLKRTGNTITLWKGKFAPRGSEMVESFEPLVVGEGEDVSALTDRTFAGIDAAHKAIFAFFMDQVSGEAVKGTEADTEKIARLLERAEGVAAINVNSDKALANMRFQLAQKRVAIAELGLQKAYREALPIYEEALKAGVANGSMLEGKVEAMRNALGLTPVAGEEGATQEAETVAIPEAPAKEKETETAVPESEEGAAVQPVKQDIGKPIRDLVKRWREGM